MSDYSLKRFYGAETAELLGKTVVAVYPSFDLARYVAEVAAAVEPLELKDRVLVMARGLRSRLPENYGEAVGILVASLGPEIGDGEGMFTHGYYLMPVARFVEEYGLEDFNASMWALGEITRRHTAEYAIRSFITRYPEQAMTQLAEWTTHESHHVRRLVSEGTRPRLPWASRLAQFIKDPLPVLGLLERLRDDPSNFVQKSVANHLNDIARDHPRLVLETAERWTAESPTENTRWIVRHALRNLVKAGDKRALAVLGFASSATLVVEHFEVEPRVLAVGETLRFVVGVKNEDERPQQAIVDYNIHFVRKNGGRNVKVFKLNTISLIIDELITLRKSHSFKLITTRRYYPGTHRVEILVNGQVVAGEDFDLLEIGDCPENSNELARINSNFHLSWCRCAA